MFSVRRILATVSITGVLLSLTACAHAQSYPTKPIRVVTTAPGSANDVVARLIAPKLSAALGEQLVVDNRGILAGEIVARAIPDGYTILFYGSPLWIGPLLRPAPYDPVTDFMPIAFTATSPNVLVVHPSMPVDSVKELIAFAKAKPGQLNYGSSSIGATPHLAAELFRAMTGVNIVRVPYKGSGGALIALIAGEVQLMFPNVGAVAPYLKSPKLKALAVSTKQPSALAPGLPTLASAGVPGYESSSPLAVFAPAKTTAAIVSKLNREMIRALESAEIREHLFKVGMEPMATSPEESAAIVKAEIAKWGKLVKDSGMRGSL